MCRRSWMAGRPSVSGTHRARSARKDPDHVLVHTDPVGEEAILLATADTDGDWRLTLDDFTATEITEYESNTQFTSGEMEASYRDGSFDDPYPGKMDEELTEEELDIRETARANRESARKYIAYKRAKALDTADTIGMVGYRRGTRLSQRR